MSGTIVTIWIAYTLAWGHLRPGTPAWCPDQLQTPDTQAQCVVGAVLPRTDAVLILRVKP